MSETLITNHPTINGKEVHKYKRTQVKKDGAVLWRCVLTNCNHYKLDAFIIGSLCCCWRCGKPFEIKGRMKQYVRPYCDDHKKAKETIETVIPENVMDSVMEKMGLK